MPRIATPDGIGLRYEEAGQGVPMLFIHEFSGVGDEDDHCLQPGILFKKTIPARRTR